jgi:polar amino acid transport system substrate-binding protein
MKKSWMGTMSLLAVLLLFIAPIVCGAAENSTLDKIKARGKLLAGVKYATVPFGFVDKNNEVVGFDVDLVREIAKTIGVEVEFVRVTSPTRIPLLVSGNADMVAASMTHTVERDKTIDFSITYYLGGQSILVRKGSGINGVGDLSGKTVAVQQGTTLEKNLARANRGQAACIQGLFQCLDGSETGPC